ncbi:MULTISPECIES: pilus assembly protein CpaE [Pseudomonas]|uniref:Putative Flp pilus assembly protein, ATPase CpaE n=1 Tax=Pseudomonas fluorescens (strain Pf0-1) TaxID=205922 RepID=Q3KIL5_PSEPF|nr:MULTISPECIES: pilus assembly protein CpaE [Pseudomonas]ABA72391.1 Putative Flp pilus assembly protein, ATPase CpaE [Pseudomonas fluorescens Pf0-1]AWA37684.1 pilus assembly protein [Pseudomonas fluorescens]MBL0795111.1 pilus assembly protein [Pseudomonas sp. B7]MBX8623600.1 pilus assembly protein [Pseudomonas glycinae]MBY9023873.1 pilus assembly protein [Pseudomonas fluorescens]
MSQSLSQTFLAITRNTTDLEWLQGALAPLGQVVSAGGGSLDELLALVDVTFASLVFVGLDREHLVAQSALIEGVLEAKPMLAIVALGDGMDNQLVLNAMRAGARDFVAYGSRSSEVAGLVRRLSKRLPAVTPNAQLGGLTVLYSIQNNADGALLANHMALVVQKSGQQTLLLDLGLPRGDSLALLGLESSFHFGDALRHLRRLDATLIDSAFTSAEAGLRILAYAPGDEPLERTSAAELYMLLSALRQHFQHIVVNLTGQPDSEALRTFVSHCDKLLWYTDQNVLDCRRNLAVLNLWREKGMKLDHGRLLVDRYLRNVAPDSDTLGRTFGLEVIAVLAYSPEVRLNAKNQGVTLFELAPREAISQSLRTLGERLAKRSEGLAKPKVTWFDRLRGSS